MLHPRSSCALVSPWRDLVPTGISGGDSQKLLSWKFQVCSHRVLLVSCGGDSAKDWPLEIWGKLVHEGEPLVRTCMWLDVLWAGFWAAWKALDRGWMCCSRTNLMAESGFPKLTYSHRNEQQDRKMWCKIPEHICFSSIPLKCSF